MQKILLLHILLPILTAGLCPALAEAYPMPSSYSPALGEPLEGMSFLYNGFSNHSDQDITGTLVPSGLSATPTIHILK